MLLNVRELEKELPVAVDVKAHEMALLQLNMLHREGDDGFITVASKQEKIFLQYHYKIKSLKSNIDKALVSDKQDVFITPNSFYKPTRKIENIRKLNSLYIDIDYYNIKDFENHTTEAVLYNLQEDYFGTEVPEPNMIIDTGRGLALYWIIEPVPYKALPLWNALQKNFAAKLKTIGADPKSIDAARVMRLAGTVNIKNGQRSKLLLYNDSYTYTLKELQQQYLPVLSKSKNKKPGRKPAVVNLYNLYSLHYARLKDLVKLQELREGYCRDNTFNYTERGQREFMCFLYRYWGCCFTEDNEKALEDTLEFNSNFKFPLGPREVERATKSAEKAFRAWKGAKVPKEEIEGEKTHKENFTGYNYKNNSLIEILNMTKTEISEMQTIIDIPEKMQRHNENRKKARRVNNLTQREQRKIEIENKVADLCLKGFDVVQIAKELNISVSTVKRYKTK